MKPPREVRDAWKVAMRRKQRGLCFYCARPLAGDETEDHVYPLAQGGTKDYANRVLAHRKCNEVKADRLPTQDELARLRAIKTPLRSMDVALRGAVEPGALFCLGDVWP